MTPLFAATMPEVCDKKVEYGEKYLVPYGFVSEDRLSENAKNEELARSLWEMSESVIGSVLV